MLSGAGATLGSSGKGQSITRTIRRPIPYVRAMALLAESGRPSPVWTLKPLANRAVCGDASDLYLEAGRIGTLHLPNPLGKDMLARDRLGPTKDARALGGPPRGLVHGPSRHASGPRTVSIVGHHLVTRTGL